ncbi:mucin-17-like [Macrobrachium nipponense]|uniref:mucin-17-like n=1 Tax=Macrobrachium nipponense TaxID=159736 RepID=UPI0030C83FA1
MPSNETTTKEELQSGLSTTSSANVSHFLESTLPPTTFNETISTNESTSTQEMTTGTELPKVTENEPPFPVFPVNNTTVSETSSTAATSPETTKSSEEWTRPPTSVSPPEVSSTLITSNTTQGVESPTTASLGTTTVSTNCTELSEKEKEALTQLHLNMSSILAKIKDMQTEIEKCMHNATSIQRVLELSSILQNLISKYQEILKSLEAYQNPKDRYRGMNFIRSALKIELRNGTPNPRSQCTDEKTPISLLRSITDLRDLLTKLKNVPEDEDMQNQVICATKRIANVLTTIAKTGDTPTEKDSSKTVKLLKEIEQFALRSVETAATQRESANRVKEEELRKQLVVLNSEKKELQDEIDEVEASLRQDEEPR